VHVAATRDGCTKKHPASEFRQGDVVMMRHTLDFGSPLPSGWTELAEQTPDWGRFIDRFGFRPGSPTRPSR
jgi:hypothetical protein